MFKTSQDGRCFQVFFPNGYGVSAAYRHPEVSNMGGHLENNLDVIICKGDSENWEPLGGYDNQYATHPNEYAMIIAVVSQNDFPSIVEENDGNFSLWNMFNEH